MTKIPRSSRRVASFDDSDSVVDANDLLFVEHYISGKYRYAQSATLSRARGEPRCCRQASRLIASQSSTGPVRYSLPGRVGSHVPFAGRTETPGSPC